MEKTVETKEEEDMRGLFDTDTLDADEYSPLSLAFIGDSVYDLIIKSIVLAKGDRKTADLHRMSSELVNASAQSRMMRAIQPRLTDKEHAIFRHARNVNFVSPPRNQSVTDYRRATGFEAVMGYLYLKKEWKRMSELVKIGLDAMASEDTDDEGGPK